MGGYEADALTLVRVCPESIASLTLVCPFNLPAQAFRPLHARLLLVHGDRGPGAASVRRTFATLREAKELIMRDYCCR
jgi:hypothetical protein